MGVGEVQASAIHLPAQAEGGSKLLSSEEGGRRQACVCWMKRAVVREMLWGLESTKRVGGEANIFILLVRKE